MKKYGIQFQKMKSPKSPFKKNYYCHAISSFKGTTFVQKKIFMYLKTIEILKMDIKKDIVSLCI